jgi:DNA-binding NarL/FixJ family response regulator
MALVLCTGVDSVLMHTRALILENAGHTVIGVMDERNLKEVCATNNFDVAVVGQTMAAQAKQRVLRLIRENCPSAKILELHREYEDQALKEADAALAVPFDVPGQRAEVVTSLAGE